MDNEGVVIASLYSRAWMLREKKKKRKGGRGGAEDVEGDGNGSFRAAMW